jgi:hypothetical protein
MLLNFAVLLKPMSYRGQTKADIVFPLVILAFLGSASAFPVFQLYGGLVGILSCPLAFLALCAIRLCIISLWGGDEGRISASATGLADLFGMVGNLVATMMWWGVCARFLNWHFFG